MLPSVLENYVIPVGVSALLHAAVLGVMFTSWAGKEQPQEIKRPNFVQATLVQLEAKPQAQPAAAEVKPKVVDLTKRQQEQDQQRQAEQKRQQEVKRRQDQEKQALAEAERKKREEAERKRKEAEKKKQDAERQAREKADAERRKQEEARSQEQARAAAQAETERLEQSYAETAQSFMSVISQRVEQHWSRPPSARNGMECELLIQLVPTGRVISVDVVRSSGNAQFDRSAMQAVNQAEQFPELRNMAPEVFERYYRELRLIFRPQDLRQ